MGPARDPRARPRALLFLFLGSGCAALIYELVWFHVLRLVIGSSFISIAALLVRFMGGIGLGSVALPRLVPRSWHPLKVYAGLELSIGVIGLILLVALPRHDTVVTTLVAFGLGSTVELLQTYAGRGRDLESWLRDAEINRDRSLRLQYLAGLALDRQDAYNIYDAIVGYRRYPRELFQVSPPSTAGAAWLGRWWHAR